ncbi:MAG: MauE/DoxX family redox-associated membrane protein [Polaribacter sp.]|uniref:heavy-metal-associated domain-containing protein n=1 Tax=Polaribacter sp. TaxID=1920175 RepID=UPI003BB105CB
MKHIYTVSGMTCNGCKNSVEKSLLSIENVESVSVDLEKKEAEIKMSTHISVDDLQKVLSEKFTITEKNETKEILVVDFKEEQKSEVQQLFPLFLIFAFITTASILININPWSTEEFMLTFMGLFYVVFSFFKLLDVKGFSTSFQMYDPLAEKIPTYGFIYPFIELTLGVFFLMRFQILSALIITLIILGITTIGVTKSLLDKKSIKCACLGSVLNLPMTKATFIENTIMILMAIFMIFQFI